MQSHHIAQGKIIPPLSVLCKDVLEPLRYEPALGVVGARVAAVLVLVHAVEEDAEEGVGKPARHRRVGKVGVDDEDGHQREDDAEPELVESYKGVPRPDDAVFVLVIGGSC